MRLLVLLVLGACATPSTDNTDAPADTDDTVDTDATCGPLPAPSAPDLDANTGTRTWSITHALPWSGEDRTIDVNVWYPTDATEGTAQRWLGLQPDEHAWIDAPLAAPAAGCKMPVVVYSHGSQAWAGNGTDLLRQLVRQGWVAIGPDHKGNTLIDNDPDKPKTYSLIRVADIVASIDALENLPATDPLAGRVDTSRVLVMGHSFGGQTTWLLSGPTFDLVAAAERCGDDCSEAELDAWAAPVGDARVAGVIPLDGDAGSDLVADAGWSTIAAPVLYLAEDTPDEALAARAAFGDVSWVEIEDACHESFTSTPLPCPTLEKEEGLEIVATYVQAFAAATVLGSTDAGVLAVLDGSDEVSPKARLVHDGTAP